MKTDKARVFNMDCMEYMRSVEDGYFELAVVDPPYGIKINMNQGRRKGDEIKHKKKTWDNNSTDNLYWEELIRVSKNQIVWGANNFYWIPPHNGYIVWDKVISGDVDFSKCELAYCSKRNSIDLVKIKTQTGS